MPGADPDDHVHAAAAVVRAPSTIITADIKDFPAKPLAKLGVTVSRPDAYLCALADRHLDDLVVVITEMAADRHHPKMTPTEVLHALERAGVPRFTTKLRVVID